MMKHWISVFSLALAVAIPAQAVVKKTTRATKPVAKQVQPAAAKPSAPVVPVAPVPEAVALSTEQMAIAEKVHLGKIQCELAVHVVLTQNPAAAGRFVLEIGHQRYAMEPVLTSTGAVRLEDPAAGAVWLQLANKSMLMNQKLGKRIADECMSADQSAVAQAMARSPAPGLLDAPRPEPVVVAQPAPALIMTATE